MSTVNGTPDDRSETAPSLRSAIAKAVGDAWDAEDVVWHDNDAADAILAMPEMQAIAHHLAADAWLRSTVRALTNPPTPDDRTDPIVFMGLDGDDHTIPRHVVEWAIGVAGDPR